MSEIGIIVPVYNVDNWCGKCIDSVLNQSHTGFDLFMVDDGATDDSGRICDMYAAEDERIIVIHKKNAGLSSARNVGLDLSFACFNNNWITFIDSDDWIMPNYLQRLLYGCTANDLSISMCPFVKSSEDYQKHDFNDTIEIVNIIDIYSGRKKIKIVSACGKLYKKSFLKDIRYPLGKVNEDAFTTHQILFMTDKLAYISQPLYVYNVRDGSIMHSAWSPKRLDEIEAYETQLSFFERENKQEAYINYVPKYLMIIANNIKETRNIEFKEYHKQLKEKLKKKTTEYSREGIRFSSAPIYYRAFYQRKKFFTVVYYYFLLSKEQGVHSAINRLIGSKKF